MANQIENDKLLRMYRNMVLIRCFEEALSSLFERGMLGGTSHFCIGEEASAVGVIWAARQDDWLISNHRGHGHLLARGLEPARVMGELMGKTTGYCHGRGGSQHMSAMDLHFLGTNGITGGGIPIGAGAAWALKYQGTDNIAIVFFGDGASNQGTFHETLNIASLWKLPVLFVCENNLYGMSNPTSRSCASKTIAPRAAAYGMNGTTCNGLDLEETYFTAQAAIERVRSGNGPELLEVMTYRQCGHSKNDPRVYRSREEEQAMAEQDSIKAIARLLAERGCPQDEIDNAAASAKEEIRLAVEQAMAAPVGDITEATSGVFAN